MRRRVLLALLTVIGVFAVLVATNRVRFGVRETTVASSDSLADSVSADSVERAARRAADTMCFASRIGLPCNR